LEAIIKLAEHNVMDYCKRLFFKGDYYKYDRTMQIIETTKIINGTKIHDDTREKLKKLIEYINKHHGVDKGIAKMEAEFGKQNIARLIAMLNAIKVNPVTIPRNQKIPFLPNLLDYFTCDTGM
jgi:hypothetical protein